MNGINNSTLKFHFFRPIVLYKDCSCFMSSLWANLVLTPNHNPTTGRNGRTLFGLVTYFFAEYFSSVVNLYTFILHCQIMSFVTQPSYLVSHYHSQWSVITVIYQYQRVLCCKFFLCIYFFKTSKSHLSIPGLCNVVYFAAPPRHRTLNSSILNLIPLVFFEKQRG